MTGSIIAAAVSMGVLGVLFAYGLYWASKKFAIETDERVEAVMRMLPGANCGACGYAGCAAMAEALVQGKVLPSACGPNGPAGAAKIAEYLNIGSGDARQMVAQVACRGNELDPRVDYIGINDCRAAHLVVAGPKACVYGCIGLGTCVEACRFDALTQDELGVPIVDAEKCTGCGACADVCPRGVIKMVPVGDTFFVRCNSTIDVRTKRTLCKTGCIGCRICERTCEYDAVHVTDGLARIDPDKCTGCGECAAKCPTKCIEPQGSVYEVRSAG